MYHRNPLFNLLIWFFTGFGYFGKRFRNADNLLTTTHSQIIDAVQDREKLKTDLTTLKIQLENERQQHSLIMNKERAHWQLEREAEKARFDMERQAARSNFELERSQATLKEKFETEQAIKRAELKAEETLVLKKLDFEQRIKQAELDKDKSVLVIKEEYAKKETELHQKLHAEMYKKLNDALIQMSAEGDKNTKFVHDLMMKIFDKAPALNSFQTINRNYSGQEALPPPQRVEAEISQV